MYYHAPKGRVTEGTLTTWGIRHARAEGRERLAAQIRSGLDWIDESRAPFALLFSAEDLA